MKKKEVIKLVDKFHAEYQHELSTSKSFNKGVNYAVKRIKKIISGKFDEKTSTIIDGIDVDNLDPSKVYFVKNKPDIYNENKTWLTSRESLISTCSGFSYSFKTGFLYKGSIFSSNLEDIINIREATKEERQILWKAHPELIPRDQPFTDWWEGQTVWSSARGKGVIVRIKQGAYPLFPLVFQINGHEYSYTTKGSFHFDGPFSELYPYPVKVVEDKSETNE